MIQIIKRENKISSDKAKLLAKQYKTTPEVISLLLNRGYKEEDLKKYIQIDEFEIKAHNSITNVDEAASIIRDHMNNDDAEIYVYGDYDCDGVMSTGIMDGVLSAVKEALESKVKITMKIPNRIEGYGLSLDWCKKTFPRKVKKDTLVITVDNGITKYKEVEYLQSKGITVIITDHHAPKAGEVPDCLVVDPWLNDLNSEDALGLCGASVAYKVCGRLLELYEADEDYIYNFLPNASIATITDIMPSTAENIGLVGLGLWLIENGYANEAINYYKKYVNKTITVKDLAFELGPQINACGRMGEVEIAKSFISSTDEEEIQEFYNHMINLNDERKELEKKLFEEIISKDFSNDLIVIDYVPNLGGLGGTVASKIVSYYNKPVILLTGSGKELHGSARSDGYVDLHALFSYEVEKGNMINFGGHKVSAGVTVDIDKIDDLRKSLNTVLASLLLDRAEQENINEEDLKIEVDDIIKLKDITRSTISPYLNIIYFGTLKEPVFAIKNINVLDARSSKNNANHLCLNLVDDTCKAKKNRNGHMVGKELWLWNKMNDYQSIGRPEKVHLIGKLVPDFRNPKYYTFDVETILPAI